MRASVRGLPARRGEGRRSKGSQSNSSSRLSFLPRRLPPSRLIRPAQTPPRKEATWRRLPPRLSINRRGGRGGWGRRSGPPSSASSASSTSSRSVNSSFGSQSHRVRQDPIWVVCTDRARGNARNLCSSYLTPPRSLAMLCDWSDQTCTMPGYLRLRVPPFSQ